MNFENSNEQSINIANDDHHPHLPFITGHGHVGSGGGGGYGWPLYVPNVPQPQQELENVPCWTSNTTPQVPLFEYSFGPVLENDFDSDPSSPSSSAFDSPIGLDFQSFLTDSNQDEQQHRLERTQPIEHASPHYFSAAAPEPNFLSPNGNLPRTSLYAEQVDLGFKRLVQFTPPVISRDISLLSNAFVFNPKSFSTRRPRDYDMDIIKKNNNNNDPESLRNSLLNDYYRYQSFIDEHSILKVFSKRAKAKVATVNTLNASLARRRGPAKFTCTIDGCDADFTRKHNLENHIKAHCGVTDRICNVCGKGFTTIPVWKRHQKTCERSNATTSSASSAGVVKSGTRNPAFGSVF